MMLGANSAASLSFDPNSAAGSFALDHDGNGTVDGQVDVAAVLDSQQSTDETAPQTTISIQGTPSNDGWYAGQITVTITAEDNAGGTGVARIDYSFDAGQTILEYTNPFTMDASSYRQIMARSIDLAGNRSWQTALPCNTLTVTHTGGGSDPVASPANSDGCASGQYHPGEAITLTASPDSGGSIVSWAGTDNNASTSTTNTFTMPDGPHQAAVTYFSTAPSMISLQRSDPDISGEVNLDLVLSVAGIEPGVSGADVYVSYDPAFVAPPSAPGVRTAEALPDFFGSANVSINELLPAAQCPGGVSPCIHLVLAGPPQSTQTGIAARYHFRGVAEGTACFAVLQSTLVNADGYPVEHAGVPQECVPVELSATASGVVNRQGIVVAAGAGAAGNGPVCSSVTAIGNETFGPTHTDAGGGYNFINLPVGTYLFRAAYPGYLTSEKNGVNVSTNVPAVDAGATTLRGGDVNGDNAINILDVATILSKFGMSGVAVRSASADCSGPDEAFDINDDGLINVSDLAITAGNWGKVGPTAWQP
jgi:hypothetical protein